MILIKHWCLCSLHCALALQNFLAARLYPETPLLFPTSQNHPGNHHSLSSLASLDSQESYSHTVSFLWIISLSLWSPGKSTLLEMKDTPPSHDWIFDCTSVSIIFIHLICYREVGVYTLTIVNNAATNPGGQTYLWYFHYLCINTQKWNCVIIR